MQLEPLIRKNYVLLSGIVGALLTVVQGFISQPQTEIRLLLMALLTAIASVIGNQWRGKGLSLTGILGGLALAFALTQEDGLFSWKEFTGVAVLQLLTICSSGLDAYKPKTLGDGSR